MPTRTDEEYPDDNAFFILTRNLKGSPLSKSDRFGDRRIDFGEKYGKSIAQLHEALRVVQNEVLSDEVNLYKNITEWALPNVRKQNMQWKSKNPTDILTTESALFITTAG